MGSPPVQRQIPVRPAEKTADTTTISQAGLDRLAADKAGVADISAVSPYRIEGPVYSLEDMVQRTGRPLIAVKMTEAQSQEIALREQQERARERINFSYAQSHQYHAVGQVVLNGDLIATVTDGGTVESPRPLPGLSEQDLSPADRLAEIARAVNGTIIHSNFLPTMGGWTGPSAPESMLPPITARSLSEILAQEIMPAMDKQIAAWEAQTGKAYPRRP